MLIVDDESVSQIALQQILEKGGFAPIVSKTGEEALELAQLLSPDLILLDIMLGLGMDGFEVCRQLRSMAGFETVPILFISGLTEEKDRRHAYKVGGTDYITKPFSHDEILNRVRVYVNRGRFQQAISETVRDFSHPEHHSGFREQALQRLRQESDHSGDSEQPPDNEYQELATLIETMKVQKIELQLHNEALEKAELLHQQKVRACQEVVDQLPVAVLGVNYKGVIIQSNRAARQLMEIDSSQLEEVPLTQYLAEPAVWSEIEAHMKTAGSLWKNRINIRTTNNTLHSVEVTIGHIRLDADDKENMTILTLIPQA